MTSTRVVVSTAFVFASALTAHALVSQGSTPAPSQAPTSAAPPAGERGQGPPGTPGQGRGGGGGRGNPAATLYTERCAGCHGLDMGGGRAPSLFDDVWARGSDDESIARNIMNGIPNTEMPGAFNLPDLELWRIVGYVQQLSRQGVSEPSSGDAADGAVVYEKSGCDACHTIAGKGGFLGPDLTDIGARRAVRHLRQSIVEPNADIPLDYRSVSVTDRRGANISGIHLNEDEYSIHLRDMSGSLRSFMKSDIAEIALPRQSLMPPFTSLSTADLENLVAYLSALRPEKAP